MGAKIADNQRRFSLPIYLFRYRGVGMTCWYSRWLNGFEGRARSTAMAAVFLGVTNTATADQFEDAEVAFQRMDYATAVALWQPLAEHGSPSAEIGLGKLLDSGFGIPKNQVQATVWFQKAASQGDAEGECIVGERYVQGDGGLSHDVSQGLALMEKAADHGNANCAGQIGELYRNGLFGVPKDHVEAAAWHRRGAEMGDASAEGRLGIDYQFGIGVQQDSAQAAYWYRKAVEQTRKEADQGNVASQLNLGQSYEWGSLGLARDKPAALYWCQKAAQQRSRIENFAEQCVARVERERFPTDTK
ncbi:tetratricopeptide repeat protein [Paraburkholderia sp. J12]|uniref:tetratricopeptide repeat protein n=1 Tax=Paraburkholderia sp. J12 TaxID=2805432 RepID=UPI002ABD5D58|nr:tetratricopeptide repeat protein [Paraburkholderia sp. J12]